MLQKIHLLGLILLPLMFCCKGSENQEIQKSTSSLASLESNVSMPADTSLKDQIKRERTELKENIAKLKVKAKNSGNKVDKKTDELLDKLAREADQLDDKNYDEKFKAEWKQFKTKVETKLDSLDKKFK
ncbi:MAG TPA: hypothetical protein VF691_21305 [Cytophagaceae bacterium]|jgi:hypothetical protein